MANHFWSPDKSGFTPEVYPPQEGAQVRFTSTGGFGLGATIEKTDGRVKPDLTEAAILGENESPIDSAG